MFAGELAKPSSICFGAFDADGRLIGYLIIARYVDAWHVMNIAVDPGLQRRGIATAMMKHLFELTGEDSRGYTLEVRVSNEAAIQLYERLGFRSRGVRRNYYTDNREDALIMWKDLCGRPWRVDTRHRDVLRRDGGRPRDPGRPDPLERRLLPG